MASASASPSPSSTTHVHCAEIPAQSTPVCLSRRLTRSVSMDRASASNVMGSSSPSASRAATEPTTPFTVAFTFAAAVSTPGSFSSSEAPVCGTDTTGDHAPVLPRKAGSATFHSATGGGGLPQPAPSSPALTAALGSPLVSPLTSFQVATPDRGSGCSGAGGTSGRVGSSGGGAAPGGSGAASPALRVGTERRFKTLTQAIGGECISSGHSASSPAERDAVAPYDTDGGGDGDRGEQPACRTSLSSPSQPRRSLDEQGWRALILMLPAAAAAGLDARSAAAAAARNSAGSGDAAGSGGRIPAAAPLLLVSRSHSADEDAAADELGLGGAAHGAAAAAAAPHRKRACGGSVDDCDEEGNGQQWTGSQRAQYGTVAEEEEAVAAQLRQPLVELTLQRSAWSPSTPAGMATALERRSGAADRRTTPGLVGGDGAVSEAALAWPAAISRVTRPSPGGGSGGGGGGSDGGAGPVFARSSGGSSSSDSTEQELTAHQLPAHGLAERRLSRPQGSVELTPGNALSSSSSSSTSKSLTLTSLVVGDVAAAALTSPTSAAATPAPSPPPAPPPPPPPPDLASFVGYQSWRSRRRRAWSSTSGSRGHGARGNSSSRSSSDGGAVDGSGGGGGCRDGGGPPSATVAGTATAQRGGGGGDRSGGGGGCSGSDGDAVGEGQMQHVKMPYPRGRPAEVEAGAEAQGSSAVQREDAAKHQHQAREGARSLMSGERPQNWPHMQPRPPARPPRRAATQATIPLLAWAEPTVLQPSSPAGADASAAVAGEAVAGLGAGGGGSQPVATAPRRSAGGMLTSSPLRARLSFRAARSSWSLSEPSAWLEEPAASCRVYGKTGSSGGEDVGSSSSESEYGARRGGLPAAGREALCTSGLTAATPAAAGPPPPLVAAARGSSPVAAVEASECPVVVSDTDFSRRPACPAVSSEAHASRVGVKFSSAPLPSALPSPPPPSPPVMYPHPPQESPPPWQQMPLPPSPKKAAVAAAVAAAEATVAMQRGLRGRSQRRLSAAPYGSKYSAACGRLETLAEEGHQSTSAAAAAAAAAVLSLGDSSSGGSNGGGDGLWSTAPGFLNVEDVDRRQRLPDRGRRSTTSASARHMYRRRRLTGEPGCSSNDDGSSDSSSSSDEYLQALLKPLRIDPASSDGGGAVGHFPCSHVSSSLSSLSYTLSQSAPSTSPVPNSVFADESNTSPYSNSAANDAGRGMPEMLAAPAPPPLLQQSESIPSRRPSGRLVSAVSAGGAAGSGTITAIALLPQSRSADSACRQLNAGGGGGGGGRGGGGGGGGPKEAEYRHRRQDARCGASVGSPALAPATPRAGDAAGTDGGRGGGGGGGDAAVTVNLLHAADGSCAGDPVHGPAAALSMDPANRSFGRI